MKRIFYLLFILFVCKISFAQNKTNNWYFGNKAGMDFNFGRISILNNSQITAPAGSATISDRNGDLLFYTNGKTVWNANHEVMENGDGLAGEINNTQTSIIIPKPGSSSIYYIFTTRMEANSGFSAGLKYSEVEISNSYPLGKVISKNNSLNIYKTERITAIHDNTGNAIWIITFGTKNYESTAIQDTFSIYKVGTSGVDTSRKTYTFEEVTTASSKGQLKISPNGKIIALASFDFTGSESLDILDFNNKTGDITYRNSIGTTMGPGVWQVPYGVSFSQDSKLLYFSGNYNVGARTSLIRQFSFEDSSDPLNSPIVIGTSSSQNFRSLQLGADGKLYVAKTSADENESDYNSIAVINSPNEKGLNCFFLNDQETLNPGFSSKGLPNFIESYFESRIFSEDKCLGEVFNFSATSYIPILSITWNFGDGTIVTSQNPTHQFTTSGTKNVKAEITLINNTVINVEKGIEVFPLPILNSNQELVQCDDDFDGISNFNLFNIRENITNPALQEEFIFFESSEDAQNESNRIINPEKFQNKIPNQEIFVKAINKNGCISFSSFRIRANYIEVDPISNMYVCEDSDLVSGNAEGNLDLIRKKTNVVSELNLDASTTLRFYNTYSDALTTTNEIIFNIYSPSTTIWVRVENNSGCGGIQSFNAIVNPQPIINLQDSYTICYDPTSKPAVVLSADISNERVEWKNSNGNIISTNQNYALTNTGSFSLTAYNTENGIECSYTKEFEVINPEKPIFTDILVNTEDETNNIVTVNISGNSTYEFSLDNKTFFGNSTSYTFTQVIPGLKTIYVRDINNCEPPIQEKVSVLGVRDFFTPNGDGKNDFWNIRGLDPAFYKSINIQIFDRFGRIVASISDFDNPGWDGKIDGKTQISNNYWFKVEIIDIDDNLIKKTGNFSLIRK